MIEKKACLYQLREAHMFFTRLISGIILLMITIGLVILGGNWLLITLGVISIIGQFELYRALKLEQSSLAIVGYLATISYEVLLYFNLTEYNFIFAMGILILLMACYVILYPNYRSEQVAMIYLGFFYVTVMLSFIYQVRMSETGIMAVWLIFIAAWGSDTCAYSVGKLIGKHKLPSKLSPNKSIEGCIGGVIGAALIGFLYATIFKTNIVGVKQPQVAFAIIGGVGSVIAQIGDLAASAIKRNHDLKDYGHLIPGHGGILDRFDSIIFTAPMVYFLITIL